MKIRPETLTCTDCMISLDEVIRDLELVKSQALDNAKKALEEAFFSEFKETVGGDKEDVEPLNKNISIHILKD